MSVTNTSEQPSGRYDQSWFETFGKDLEYYTENTSLQALAPSGHSRLEVFAEGVKYASNASGNLAWYGMAEGLKMTKDASMVRAYWSSFVSQYPGTAQTLAKIWDPASSSAVVDKVAQSSLSQT